MISTPDPRRAVELVEEAMVRGWGQSKAGELPEIRPRTYQRWTQEGGITPDGRPEAVRPAPANRVSGAERPHIVPLCNQPEDVSPPPSAIVPGLADAGEHVAPESTFYRVLRQAGQANPRGRA